MSPAGNSDLFALVDHARRGERGRLLVEAQLKIEEGEQSEASLNIRGHQPSNAKRAHNHVRMHLLAFASLAK